LDYHHKAPPKSIGREWAEAYVFPLIDAYEPGIALATVYAYIADQIAREVRIHGLQNVLITGGGARNTHLINVLQEAGVPFHVPEVLLVDFKEALIFAFLGLLRIMGRTNVLAHATGASKDHCSGVLLGG
jgi:anhydro-N-acetylmuramic acid kinase